MPTQSTTKPHLADDQEQGRHHSDDTGGDVAVSSETNSDSACKHANNGDERYHASARFDLAFFDLIPDTSTKTGATTRLRHSFEVFTAPFPEQLASNEDTYTQFLAHAPSLACRRLWAHAGGQGCWPTASEQIARLVYTCPEGGLRRIPVSYGIAVRGVGGEEVRGGWKRRGLHFFKRNLISVWIAPRTQWGGSATNQSSFPQLSRMH